jgi:phage FluMu gp28-like protein
LLEVFSDSRIVLYEDRELIRDLGRLQLVERATGWRLKAAHDETGHADRAIAMAIALPHAVAWSKELIYTRYEERLPGNFRVKSVDEERGWTNSMGLSCPTYIV